MKRMKHGHGRHGHQGGRYVVLRAMLAMGSLVGMLLASGAGTHWH